MNEIFMEEEDDEDDEGELYPDVDYSHYDDESTEDNISIYKASDSPSKTSDDDVPSDVSNTIFFF